MSETRQRAAKRALPLAVSPAVAAASAHAYLRAHADKGTEPTLRRTRRRMSSSDISTDTRSDSEPESEELMQQPTAPSCTTTTTSDAAATVHIADDNADVHTPDADVDVDSFSVISGDASPHGSVFDFLAYSHSDPTPFSLFTPSPGFARFSGGNASIASSPLTMRRSPSTSSNSALSSPSRFFRSPFNSTTTSHNMKSRKKKRRAPSARQLQQLLIASDNNNDADASAFSSSASTSRRSSLRSDTAAAASAALASSSSLLDALRTPRVSSDAKDEIPQLLDLMSLASTSDASSPWPRATLFTHHTHTPSPSPTRMQLLSRRLMADFDRERNAAAGDEEDEDDEEEKEGDSEGRSRSDTDALFSFALSPLVQQSEDTDDDAFASSFLPIRLSPLTSLSTITSLDAFELPRLIPSFPLPRLDDDVDNDNDAVNRKAPATTTKTPVQTPSQRRAVLFTGASTSTPATTSSSRRWSGSFPNVQASTSATPGQLERSQINTQSIRTMKLHVVSGNSGVNGSFPTLGHAKRDIQAINDSLRKKSRKRKLEDTRNSSSCNGLYTSAVEPVQRKLLQTPLKEAPLDCNTNTQQDETTRTPLKHEHLSSAMRSYAVTATRLESTPVLVSTSRVLTPSSTWQMSRSIPPPSSGLAPSGALTKTATTLQTRRTPTRQQLTRPATAATVDNTQTMTPLHHTHNNSSSSLLDATKSTRAPCNCKKSKCLKLYCECFASGGYCDENCNCHGCANTPATEVLRQQAIALRLEKNPNAFKPKIELATASSRTPGSARARNRSSNNKSSSNVYATPAGSGRGSSASKRLAHPLRSSNTSNTSSSLKKMHKHGCHCKKSACQKKYCECFQAGVPCGDNCRCIDCKNQAPCASHASSGTASATATPSRLQDMDDTFVSPVLRNVRQRLRLDRASWAKNVALPYAPSASHSSNGSNALSVRLSSVPPPATGAFTTPTGSNTKRQKLSVSPVSECTPPLRATPSTTPSSAKAHSHHVHFAAAVTPTNLLLLDKQTLHSHRRHRRRASMLSTMTHPTTNADRVLLYPLFGDALPPVKSVVSAQICRFLTNADLYNVSLVNKLWNHVALGETVWDHANFVRAPIVAMDDDDDGNGAVSECVRRKQLKDEREDDRNMSKRSSE